MLQTRDIPNKEEEQPVTSTNLPRRNFLTKLFGAAAVTTVAVSCTKSYNGTDGTGGALQNGEAGSLTAGGIDFGSGDIAILNYAFLLEQLEAQFYTTVTQNYYRGINDQVKTRLAQIRDHEIAHREFFKTALGTAAIPDLTFDFSSIDFSSRMSVLESAKTFEDLGVSAYNGVANYIVTPDYLLTAGKIVSVEARHAAYIRDLLQPISFANASVVNSMGLDQANPPEVVIQSVIPYLSVPLNTQKAPW